VPLFDDSKDEDRELAIELKRQWESRLKIRVEIVFATTVAQYLLLRDSEAYHVLLRDFNVDSGDPLNFYSAYGHGARFKMEWPDRRYQVMLQEAGRAKTESERNRTIAQLDDYLLKETVTVVPLYYRGDLSVVRSSIKGYDGSSWQPYFLKNLSFK
jgi:ABC-type oligopeptide transport system substrate-binding subunit